MRTIVHISDLHFGRTTETLVKRLQETIAERRPSLVIVSGDLTQRARRIEFKEARDFFAALPVPLLIVPGNHDIPLYSFWKRVVRPYRHYKTYISHTLEPEYRDDEIIVAGVNTVRTFKIMDGRINSSQLERLGQVFTAENKPVTRIVVAHHPFYIPTTHRDRAFFKMVGGVRRALDHFRSVEVDLLLTGHLHTTWSGHHEREPLASVQYRGPLMVQAGTAISTRLRHEANTFNLITIDHPRLTIDRFESTPDFTDFRIVKTEPFERHDEGWLPLASKEALVSHARL